MILIADSGSTKTHWKLLKKDGSHESHYTKGLNPYFAGEEYFHNILSNDLTIYKNGVREVYFYGSGCGTESKVDAVKNFLKPHFPAARIAVHSDLLGAARALLGKQKGIACILGTGSVSCVYNGKDIAQRVPSLGFILGDEGGGAALGRELLRAYFYNKLPGNLHRLFEESFSITRDEVLESVYHGQSPNAYLASFSKFFRANYTEPALHDIIRKCFREFFTNHITVYSDYQKLPLTFTGSVSYNLKEVLAEVAGEYGTTISKVIKEPMEGLVEFHKGS